MCGSMGVTINQDGALRKRQRSAVFRHSQIRPNYNCRVLEGGRNGVSGYRRMIYLVVDFETSRDRKRTCSPFRIFYLKIKLLS